jgi:hypothetical protein
MPNEIDMQLAGYEMKYDYTQYSHDNHVNVIPEDAFKRLVTDTFKVITDVMRRTYGPYGSTALISDQSETTTTKDGYNVFQSMGFGHVYMRMVYLAISKIIERVNRNVGDGTTSCILLAEKIFNHLNEIIKTADDKRQILSILTNIESYLQNMDAIEFDKSGNGVIKPLTLESFSNIINLASNYDDNLTNTLVEALAPVVDDKGNIVSIRNVISESDISLEADSAAKYEIKPLPGDYRVRINIGIEQGIALADKTTMKVVVYDHAFSSTDWTKFMNLYDNETKVLILARSFTRGFLECDWVNYLKEKQLRKKLKNDDPGTTIYIAEVKGNFVQNEIKDLCAIIGTEPRGIHASDVKFSEEPDVTFNVYNGNCLAIYDVTPPERYIELLEAEWQADTTNSYVKKQDFMDRIKSLSMTSQDTIVIVKCGTSLEAKMIMDKIDDCTSIINSAINSGVVPNLLSYAHYRMNGYGNGSGPLTIRVANEIADSITGLFADIWRSKYGDIDEESAAQASSIINAFYESKCTTSYDIINDKFVDVNTLPTSAQYDLEVVVAAISIVKYLLTSRALIFDAHILTTVKDDGHYTQMH